ncbi:hypothetical protein [Methyloceanibacter superfactus]|uniref:hypothetical protein n=1 Tax=Methyloceanibacter superfactus TaxID=1774969 RepID=UPI00114C899F|nr:hypothetical protein [Methyloceanibacter superfactus]
MSVVTDIRDYPWTTLLAAVLPARLTALLPKRFQAAPSQIVPSASIAGNALAVVIAIMTFLACLTAGGVYMINQSAQLGRRHRQRDHHRARSGEHRRHREEDDAGLAISRQTAGHHPG